MRHGSGFFDHRRVLLRHLIDLPNRGIDSLHAGKLFRRGPGDPADTFVDVGDILSDLAQRGRNSADQFDAIPDLVARPGNQFLDLLGSLCRALRQFAHFRGHDCKPHTRLACTRSFDSGIECQEIRLESDFVDHRDDFRDLAAGFFDPLHRIGRLRNDLRGAVRMILRRIGNTGHFVGAARRFLDCGGDLLECR